MIANNNETIKIIWQNIVSFLIIGENRSCNEKKDPNPTRLVQKGNKENIVIIVNIRFLKLIKKGVANPT